MDAARWTRLQTLFHDALDRPTAERDAFLEAACADDPTLADDVRALLEADAGTSELDRDLGTLARDVLDVSVPPGRTVGPYRVERVLGRGGMGVVYRATRDDLGRPVALKVLRDAALSPARRERFAREQQTLAQLTHPAIARLYDAAALPDGTPYFVMEYVAGLPITEHCAAHGCALGERLRLFEAVCEAVQHAHGQAVIHRDLKPSNIFVDASGQVKLLDFGIAKHLDALGQPAEQTQAGLRLMTPAYAAPEQLRGEAVGVYTDVYALGVVLYELLTGRHPYDLDGKTSSQVEQILLEQEPQAPSAVTPLRDEAAGKSAWADLDVLCLAAMHKDPQRRYATVEALLRDLRRFREGRPLEARPDTLGYRAGKFLRRHREPALAAALVAAVIIGLVAFYTARLATARDAALAEAARTERVQTFMLTLFAGDEAAGPADSLRVVTLVGQGMDEARVLDAEPALQADLYQILGGIYVELGDFEQADSLLKQALAQRRRLYDADHAEVARSMTALSLLRNEQSRFEEAEHLARDALAMSRRHLPARHPDVAAALYALGFVQQRQGAYDEAVQLLSAAAQLQAPRGDSPALSASLGKLANAHFFAGHYATSDSLNRALLALDERLYGRRHPSYATRLINLAATQREQGYPEKAERLYRQALTINQDYYATGHPLIASNLSLLGGALADQKKYDEATAVLEKALALRERALGPEHTRVALTLNKLGHVALARDHLDAADTLFSRQIAIYRATLPGDHPWIATGYSNLSDVYRKRGDLEQAEETLHDVVGRYTRALGADHLNAGIAQIKLGRVLAEQERYAEAEAALRGGYVIVDPALSPSSKWRRIACEHLAATYRALDQPEEATRFQGLLAEAEATAQP